MIYVGIDDTDTIDTPGTNQLGRAMAAQLADRFRLQHLVRHQLFFDPRVPYTSKNGSASLVFEPLGMYQLPSLIDELRHAMQAWYVEGSDPGLCVTEAVPLEFAAFGRRCQTQIMTQAEARALAAAHGVHLEGLGGTEGGVIGALAAVGLISLADNGRVVVYGTWPDDLSGPQEIAVLHARNVVVREFATNADVTNGRVDIGKHLRPNLRGGRVVQLVEPNTLEPGGSAIDTSCPWRAVKVV